MTTWHWALRALTDTTAERTFNAPADSVALIFVDDKEAFREAADVLDHFRPDASEIRFVRTNVSADLVNQAGPYRRLLLRDLSRVSDEYMERHIPGIMATRMTILNATPRESARLVAESILTPVDSLYIRLLAEEAPTQTISDAHRLIISPQALRDAYDPRGGDRPADVLSAH